MKRNDAVYLRHIVDCANRIEEYLQNVDEARFKQTPLVQGGVIRQIEIIGEASKQLSEKLRSQNPHVPWRACATSSSFNTSELTSTRYGSPLRTTSRF